MLASPTTPRLPGPPRPVSGHANLRLVRRYVRLLRRTAEQTACVREPRRPGPARLTDR
jgi:hypothetical protein